MEKSVTTGMQPEDFSGHCPTCSVECQEDILKLISKFCRGIVVELTGVSLPSSRAWEANDGWPTFVVSGGANANSFLEVASKREVRQGDIRFGYSHLYQDQTPITQGSSCSYMDYGPFVPPSPGPPPVSFPRDSGATWTQRHTDHIDSLSNSNSSADVGVDEIIEGQPDFAVNSVTTVIETIDLYSTEEHFAIFPVCGKLRVEDSGTSYIPIKACINETVLDSDGNPVNRGSCTTTYDTKALHILVSSDCPDPHIAKTSEHPHLVGRGSEPDTLDTYPNKRENPAYSDKREFDNVEQQMHLGMCRTTYAVKVGSVYKTTISGAFDGDHVYYTSVHPESLAAVPSASEKAAQDLCPGEGAYYTHPYSPGVVRSLLQLAQKKYTIDSFDPNWLNYCTPEWDDKPGAGNQTILGRRWHELGCWTACPNEQDAAVWGRGKDSRGYYYCAYKLNDLAQHTISAKEFIFASKQDVINSMNTQVSRQKLNSSSGMAMDHSPVGCFQSRLVTFANPDDFGFGYTLSSGGGVDISEMENEAFSISGSILYNRDKTKQYDLKDGLWSVTRDFGFTTQAENPVVGVTFYEAKLSYRTFADRVELKTDHDLVWNNIYERSLGFGSATIPAGYATGGFSKKADLDTPEKALKAWTFPRWGRSAAGNSEWFTNADLDMAGFFYRWTQDKYYYDAVQQACDFSGEGCTGTGELMPGDDPFAFSGCPDTVEGRPYTEGRPPQAQITTTVCQAGILIISEGGKRTNNAPFPPLFDEDQRVHGDGTIDFDDFSYATKTVKNVYTEDPNNPDVFVPDPSCGGCEFHNGVRGYWRRNGTYEDQEQFVSGAKCLTTATLPDPDYDYYIYRPKIKAMPDPHHPDAGIFDWSVCGEEYSGYGDTWPCTKCWGIDRHDSIGGGLFGKFTYRGAHGCMKCMSSRVIPGSNPMVGGTEVCNQKFCNSGYWSSGEPHSPLNAGYIWYSNMMAGKALTGFYAGTIGSFSLTSCCDVYCYKCSDACFSEKNGKCGGGNTCFCLQEGPSTLTDAAMGCRLIKILKPTASTISSVNLGSLSIKVSLK